MSTNNLRFDDDVENILNEVENFDHEDLDTDHIDVDDLLKEDLVEHKASVAKDYGDPLNILSVPAPKKEAPKPKPESIEHPFVVLEQQERDISSKLGGQTDFNKKFVVMNYEKTMKKDFPNVTYDVLDTISDYCFPDTNSELPVYEDQYWGTPKCLAVSI